MRSFKRTAVLAIGVVSLAACASAASSVAQTDTLASASEPRAAAGLIGIHATGPQPDLARLQAVATSFGLPNQQMDGPEGWQLVIAFPPGTAPETVQKFINQLRGNEFSTLQFRSAVAPVR